MKKMNFKGSALVQVLVLGALIATIVVVLLKFSITRTSNMVQTRNIVTSKLAVQGCFARLNEEEIRRATEGLPPYFEEESTFPCASDNYTITVTRGNYENNNHRDHSTGVVRPLTFTITLFNPNNQEEDTI
ncbi:MAG: hypothetical protein IKP23_05830 [Elusimicrobiaceae bacterium]|nr:hypothetical protein [Elusimicrobiaceae bacterium]